MNFIRLAGLAAVVAWLFASASSLAQATGGVSTPAVYVPDPALARRQLPDNVFVWDATSKSEDVTNGQPFAKFTFAFTNEAVFVSTSLATNLISITNFTVATNHVLWWHHSVRVPHVTQHPLVVTLTNSIRAVPVKIFSVHPSCGCTTAQIPPLPWTIPAGSNDVIGATVNLAEKSGTLFKTIIVGTDQGSRTLTLRINILPPLKPQMMSDAERARALELAKVDRQAVFRNDCANCHARPTEGKYGKDLFDAACAICHEAEHRATMVPNLQAIKTPTNMDFWRTWITHGKPGTLMPAFSNAEGGPLNDLQIASLAAYLNVAISSKVPQPKE